MSSQYWAHAACFLPIEDFPLYSTKLLIPTRQLHGSAVEFLDIVAASRYIELVFLAEDMERSSAAWLRQHDEREYSFVDATSFATMRPLRIAEVLAFDGDFSAAGFRELRAEPV